MRLVNRLFLAFTRLLDSFEADIICFQETKLTRESIDDSIAAAPGYDAYFSICRGRAYSGVVTYCKQACSPMDALDGISGALSAWYGSQVCCILEVFLFLTFCFLKTSPMFCHGVLSTLLLQFERC